MAYLPARPDLDQLRHQAKDLLHAAQRAELEAAYPQQRQLMLVAEEGGLVAGAAMGFVSCGSEVTLRILAVAACRRWRGIGRALLRAFEANALRLGATRISQILANQTGGLRSLEQGVNLLRACSSRRQQRADFPTMTADLRASRSSRGAPRPAEQERIARLCTALPKCYRDHATF